MLGIKYCKINRDPTARSSGKDNACGIVNRCVTLLIEMDANALKQTSSKEIMSAHNSS